MVHADAEVTNKDREGREIMRPRLNRRSEDAISILRGLCEESIFLTLFSDGKWRSNKTLASRFSEFAWTLLHFLYTEAGRSGPHDLQRLDIQTHGREMRDNMTGSPQFKAKHKVFSNCKKWHIEESKSKPLCGHKNTLWYIKRWRLLLKCHFKNTFYRKFKMRVMCSQF